MLHSLLFNALSAFDMVDHEILLQRLETSFGLPGSPLNYWFHSYLSDRSQMVVLGDTRSSGIFLKPGHFRNPIVQDAHGHLRTMEIELKKWCDNDSYFGLMQRITCELSNLSNKLSDTKANQSTRSKNPTTPSQLAIDFSFSYLSLLPNPVTSFRAYMVK